MREGQQIWFPSSDGIHCCAGVVWRPEGDVRGIVQIVHGIAEHMGRYAHFAQFLTDNGYLVCGEDHLGHGKTGERAGKLGFFARHNGWDLVTADVHAFREQMGDPFPHLPYFLLGHSMGSFLTRTYLCRYPGTVSGAILSGTGQENPVLVGAGKTMAAFVGTMRGMDSVSKLIHGMALGGYNRQFRPNRTTADWLSRDEQVVDAYLTDPLCTFIPTVGLYRDMLGGLQYIASQESLSHMDPDTPIYLFSGDRDPVGGNGVGVRKVYRYFQAHGTRDLQLKFYHQGRHESLNEENRDEVYADVLAWLEEHI